MAQSLINVARERGLIKQETTDPEEGVTLEQLADLASQMSQMVVEEVKMSPASQMTTSSTDSAQKTRRRHHSGQRGLKIFSQKPSWEFQIKMAQDLVGAREKEFQDAHHRLRDARKELQRVKAQARRARHQEGSRGARPGRGERYTRGKTSRVSESKRERRPAPRARKERSPTPFPHKSNRKRETPNQEYLRWSKEKLERQIRLRERAIREEQRK